MSRARIAIVGCGWVTQHCYLPHLGPQHPLEVVAVYDPDFPRAQEAAVAVGLQYVAADFDACLGPDVDGVIICIPSYLHLPMLLRSLIAGKYVLCEKPVIRDETGLALLKELPAAARSRLMGSATTRLRRDVALALSWVREGRIGQLRRMSLSWWRGRGVPTSGMWRTSPQHSPTGVLEDLGPHLLDLAASLLPGIEADVELLEAQMECRYGDVGRGALWYGASTVDTSYMVPDFARAVFSYRKEVLVECEVCWASETEGDASRLIFEGSRGSVTVEGLFGFSTSRREPGQFCFLERHGHPREVVEFQPGPAGQLEAFGESLEIFARFCTDESPPLASATELMRVASWLALIQRGAVAHVEAHDR